MSRPEVQSFDEARLQLVRGRMAQIGADATGMPTDPKAFTWEQARSRPAAALPKSAPAEEADVDSRALLVATAAAVLSLWQRRPCKSQALMADGHAVRGNSGFGSSASFPAQSITMLAQGLMLIAVGISIALVLGWPGPHPVILTESAAGGSLRGVAGASASSGNFTAPAQDTASIFVPLASGAIAVPDPPHGL